MAKTQNSDPFTTFRQAFEGFQDRFEMPSSARDLARRTADAAAERLDSAEAQFGGLARSQEKLAGELFEGGTRLGREMANAAFANMRHTVGTMQKAAGARSLGELFQIQAEFVRETVAANLERLQGHAEIVRDMTQTGARAVQDVASSAAPKSGKAA